MRDEPSVLFPAGRVKMADDSVARNGLLDRSWAFWAMLTAATVLGAALRLYGLGKPSFWVDEFFTIARSGTEPLHWAQAVGYFPTWLSLWLHGADLGRISLANIAEWPALGVSERTARLGACWVGVVTVPVLAVLARAVAGAGVAGVSALLLAITPWHLYWSQMARFYTLQFLFANAFVLLFARGMQTGRRSCFAVAVAAGILALLSHPTTIFVVGACGAVVGLAWIARLPVPNLGTGLRWLAVLVGFFALIVVSRELPLLVQGGSQGIHSSAVAAELSDDSEEPSWLVDKAVQSWGPPFLTLVLGTVLRIEPVVFAVGVLWVIVSVRRRDPFGIFASAVAVLVPLSVLALSPLFPIGPRYYFPCLFAWALLASMWAVEIDRHAGASAGGLGGTAALVALLVAVGFNTYLYSRDGAGARTRWREACEYVLQHGGPNDPVFAQAGGFQTQYYLGRDTEPIPTASQLASLPRGSWVIQRSRGARAPTYGDVLDVKARYEIPSKPWSWVLYVMRAPGPPGEGAERPPDSSRESARGAAAERRGGV